MRREDIGILVLWVVLVTVLVTALAFGLPSVIETLGDVAVAVIGAAAVLLGGILTHALTVIREQRLEQQREKQRHYAELLKVIDELVRKPGAFSDEVAKVHLASWVVGSATVVRQTHALVHAKTAKERTEALKALLLAMRRDIGLSAQPDLPLTGVFPSEGYVEQEESGG